MNQLGLSTLNSLKSKNIFLKNFNQIGNVLNFKIKRTFLTENYYCYEQWDKFLLSDVVKKVGLVNGYSLEINDRLNKKSLVTPLDMDLLATKLIHINNLQELEFIENIFANFRKTQPALFVRDSMHYSFVRNYMDLNQADRLLQILKLKYKYGIYLDYYTANMLMDYFIKQKDFKKAALTAHEILLQEYSENEMTQAACLLSCMNYIKEFGTTEESSPKEDDQDEKKTKVLVYFLRKSYNDEHFDLKSMPLLCGKTIYFSSSNAKSADPVLVDSLKIYGLLIFGKYDKAISIFEDSFVKKSSKLYKFVVEEFKLKSETLTKNEESLAKYKDFIEKWTNFSKLCETNGDKQLIGKDLNDGIKAVENYLESVRNSQTNEDIKVQNDLFIKWNKEQENELNQQIKNFTIELKKESILKRLDDLEKQEEMLTFFDKRQKIIDAYYGKGFSTEYPSDMPIEPDESIFKAKYERHFKPWQKYMNKPESFYKVNQSRQAKLESLRKIYNLTAQTTNQNTPLPTATPTPVAGSKSKTANEAKVAKKK